MNLEDISQKIGAILNGTDAETESLRPDGRPFSNFTFMVATEGYHLDHIYNEEADKNLIPVYVGALGGSNEPIPDLGAENRNTVVTIYFPVRFKEQMKDVDDYLAQILVGRVLTWGIVKARSNTSPSQFGELFDMDTRQFSDQNQQFVNWIDTQYHVKMEVSEMWMSMQFTLYLSTAKDLGVYGGFLMGDHDAISKLTIRVLTPEAADPYYDIDEDDPVMIDKTGSITSEPAAQQILGESSVKGFGATTTGVRTISFYMRSDRFCKTVAEWILKKQAQGKTIIVTESIPLYAADDDRQPLSAVTEYYILNASLDIRNGVLMTCSLQLGDSI